MVHLEFLRSSLPVLSTLHSFVWAFHFLLGRLFASLLFFLAPYLSLFGLFGSKSLAVVRGSLINPVLWTTCLAEETIAGCFLVGELLFLIGVFFLEDDLLRGPVAASAFISSSHKLWVVFWIWMLAADCYNSAILLSISVGARIPSRAEEESAGKSINSTTVVVSRTLGEETLVILMCSCVPLCLLMRESEGLGWYLTTRKGASSFRASCPYLLNNFLFRLTRRLKMQMCSLSFLASLSLCSIESCFSRASRSSPEI